MKKFPRCFVVCWLVACLDSRGSEPLAIQEAALEALPIAALSASPAPAAEKPLVAEKPAQATAEKAPPENRCAFLITVTDDFIVAAYKNGEPIAPEKRELLLDRFGATAEKVAVSARPGDWLVFHVVQNPVRWGGSRYFAVAGCLARNEFGFVSDPASADWSVCDDPAKAAEFIQRRDAGTGVRALPIANPWKDGDELMRRYAGSGFGGKALWGSASSTWIKFAVPGAGIDKERGEAATAIAKDAPPADAPVLLEPKRWPVQILSAIYGTGGKDADVTARVKEHVEICRRRFAANPVELGADPNPFWNKGLHIIYMKDGVRREQHRNENEHILPESFYGPQDAAELRAWLPESRWSGEGGEVQFHPDGTFSSPAKTGSHRWEVAGPRKLRLTWADQPPVLFSFDFVWGSFAEVQNGKNVFHLLK